mmetsp:Transcript_6660/g.17141  ORF Transcript_6660/g.17141 Transcript_6660/m.17141 type:complete len:283 (+) Transcript_6660:180-1028(+)
MPTKDNFKVELVVGGSDGIPERVLNEVTDTTSGRVYAVSRAGDEYKVRMSGPGIKHVGAILQIDGLPHRDDFRKSPFTYFKKPYLDPGFWVDPAGGKYQARVFGCPEQVEGSGAAAAATSPADEVGVIRVFFFDVHRIGEEAAARRYAAPSTAKVQESKKWYMASTNTRYAAEKKSGTTRGCKFQITDRSKPLMVLEVRYKDETSLKLLGWDGKSPTFAYTLPWEKQKKARGVPGDAAGGDAKRRKIESIDLTIDDDSEEEADDVIETAAPKKPEPVHILVE